MAEVSCYVFGQGGFCGRITITLRKKRHAYRHVTNNRPSVNEGSPFVFVYVISVATRLSLSTCFLCHHSGGGASWQLRGAAATDGGTTGGEEPGATEGESRFVFLLPLVSFLTSFTRHKGSRAFSKTLLFDGARSDKRTLRLCGINSTPTHLSLPTPPTLTFSIFLSKPSSCVPPGEAEGKDER